jgi:predicted dehydrogenase
MQELARIVAKGQLGQILHIEGNYSNENSRKMFAAWRDSPAEAPGGAMTGTALHVLDAFVHLLGPVQRVQAQLLSRRPPPDPLDVVSVLVEFTSGASGLLASMRPSPFFWRVHVFGTTGSAEAIGETDLVLRLAGEAAERKTFPQVDSLRAEFDAFADAVAGYAKSPIPVEEMIDTTAAFEAVTASIEQRTPVAVAARG